MKQTPLKQISQDLRAPFKGSWNFCYVKPPHAGQFINKISLINRNTSHDQMAVTLQYSLHMILQGVTLGSRVYSTLYWQEWNILHMTTFFFFHVKT